MACKQCIKNKLSLEKRRQIPQAKLERLEKAFTSNVRTQKCFSRRFWRFDDLYESKYETLESSSSSWPGVSRGRVRTCLIAALENQASVKYVTP